MSMQDFLNQGWGEHADQTEAVAARLPQGLELAENCGDLANHASLVVHVFGEHLGRWQAGLDLLERASQHAHFDAASAGGKSVYRSMAVLQHCAGNREAAEALIERGQSAGANGTRSDRARVLAIAASALAGQKRTADAMRTFNEALEQASYGPAADDPAARALAITGNNLACELEETATRTAEQTELMKLAARSARTYWEISGTWDNVAWAEYRLAMTHLKAGEPAVALEHAHAQTRLLAANDAPPFARFFGREALARALHAAGAAGAAAARDEAAALIPQVDEDNREYCRGELAKLDAILAGGA